MKAETLHLPASWFRCRLCGKLPDKDWGPRNGCQHEWIMVRFGLVETVTAADVTYNQLA